MKAFSVTGFKGFWPVGTAAVVIAPDLETAQIQLAWELKEHGLSPDVSLDKFQELDLTKPNTHILCDGNY